jgi:DNA (cytosine-5)-methyltransferase 1
MIALPLRHASRNRFAQNHPRQPDPFRSRRVATRPSRSQVVWVAGAVRVRAVDLFAGPGGWDHGIESLGIRPLGIEWDEAACKTREVRGLLTLQADVSELDPLDFEAELLIASPPCQAFSLAGKGQGHQDVPVIMQTARALGEGRDTRASARQATVDDRSLLVVEPLRFALALKPRWIAFEQVPPVLSLWRVFAEILRGHGYSCWAGLLTAEAYGVPQTRERAFLLASRAATVSPPEPTHQTYVFGEPAAQQHTFTGTLAPWISMAQALGWGEGERAYRLARGEGMLERHGERPDTPDSRPAPVVTSKARTASWVDQRPAPTIVTTRRSKDGLLVGRQMAEGEGENVGGWGYERPATTIAGDSRVFQPGGHHEPGKQSQNAVRVTLQEAAILQGFPPDYPFQGSRTKQFEQVGNAVPPPLAQAVIRTLVADAIEAAA